MYVLKLENVENTNPYEELIKLFLQPSQYRIVGETGENGSTPAEVFRYEGDKNRLKRELYVHLNKLTGQRPKWGILTGIRPVKLAGELYRQLGSQEKAHQCLIDQYLVEEGKADLLFELYNYQQKHLGHPAKNTAGIYLGIPFCPTRCLYCSFPSNQKGPEEIERYLTALFQEIQFVGREMTSCNMIPESIYIGGGTPTTLTTEQTERLLLQIATSFDLSHLKEFTVEAGRPDTITREKLEVLKKFGVERISINPQTMKEQTLETIGRSHTAEQTRQAFKMAHESGIPVINADLIAGLPGETADDFQQSLKEVMELGAKNITLHTLAVKRTSRLKEVDENFHYKQPVLTEGMLDDARKLLTKQNYKPYYLYRQKHIAGSTENIGYCKEDLLSVYNVRIMEEAQSIIALGAGGITKVYYPDENRLERVPNVSNYEIYIERIEEMIERKRKNLFRR